MPFRTRGRIAAVALLAAALSVAAWPAQAADPQTFPAGLACEFPLEVVPTSGGNIVDREFHDAEGNVVRLLQAGKGEALTFTNLTTDASVSSTSNGFAIRTVFHPDGSITITMTGHTLLIMFPADIPAGPTTTLYTGRVTFDITSEGVFILTGSSGRERDICGELTP